MSHLISDFFQVPPAAGAAPAGCIRITILNRHKRGLTLVYRLDDVPRFLEGVGATIDLESDTPTEIMKAVAGAVKGGRISEEDAPMVGILALYVARKSDDGLAKAIDIVAEATGRAALLIRERKSPTALRASWEFLVGVEKGTNELSPVGHA